MILSVMIFLNSSFLKVAMTWSMITRKKTYISHSYFNFLRKVLFCNLTIVNNRFLCAMPPHMRPDWGKRMAEIIKPGGTLIALQYPLKEKAKQPPFTLSVEM